LSNETAAKENSEIKLRENHLHHFRTRLESSRLRDQRCTLESVRLEQRRNTMKRSGNFAGKMHQIAGPGTATFRIKRRDKCEHVWISGDINHVCSRCGYLKPKKELLPQKGL